MIDSKARQEARAISEGANPRQDIAPKIAYYGLVARALDPGQLPEKLHLSPDFCTFARIEELLMCTLKEAAGAGFSELSKANSGKCQSGLRTTST